MLKKLIKKILDRFYSAPPRFAGGLILNLLGYQIFRMLFFYLAYLVRRKIPVHSSKEKAILHEVLENGVAVIPNFFPQDVFEKIKEEYFKMSLPIVNERTPYIRRVNLLAGRHTPLFNKYLAHNEFANKIISSALRKTINIEPKIQIEEMYYDQMDIGKPTTDERSDLLHFDVSYPTYKYFLYLSDTTEQNAAFSFVKKSHRLTLTRLWLEYKMSVKFFTWSKKRRCEETPLVDYSFLEKHGLKLQSLKGKANSVIIANTMGFHRRGDFLSTTHRHMIIVSYRELDSLKYLTRSIRQ